MPLNLPLITTSAAGRIELRRDGTGQPLVTQQACVGERPYLHPIRTPVGCTVVTEDAPGHHPWQHGLYFGLNGVNGFGFWTEGLRNNPTDGRIRVTAATSANGAWRVNADWIAPAGGVLLSDALDGNARLTRDALEIDLLWTVTARVDVAISRYDYGGLFLRMPFRDGVRATLLTPGGARTPAEVEGAPSPWLGVAMEIDGADASVVLMDAPSNAGAPALWRADGEYGIGPAIQRQSDMSWPAGNVARYAYRVRVSDGVPSIDQLSAAYDRFIGERR